jgi:hypothetical protein
MRAPVKNKAVVDATWRGEAPAMGAARRVENKHGKNR